VVAAPAAAVVAAPAAAVVPAAPPWWLRLRLRRANQALIVVIRMLRTITSKRRMAGSREPSIA